MKEYEYEYEVENGIPIPKAVKHRKYPLREIEIGQSFFIPNRSTNQVHGLWGHIDNKKFVARLAHKDIYDEQQKKFIPTKGSRIWRVE